MTAEQAFNDQANRSAQEAKDSLLYYFERAGVVMGGDTIREINEIVDNIVDAAVAATRAALEKAMRTEPRLPKAMYEGQHPAERVLDLLASLLRAHGDSDYTKVSRAQSEVEAYFDRKAEKVTP